MFKRGNLYRNKYNTDIDVVVVSNPESTDDAVYMDVLYWNRIYQAYCQDKFDYVKVNKKDIINWELLKENFYEV